MALYTIVDEGYNVKVFKSFESLWTFAGPCSSRWLDEAKTVKLTQTALRKELREQGCAFLFDDRYCDDYGWVYKIQKHGGTGHVLEEH
ncbi:hypothetical protein [Acidithiobacillus ferridurans]|uniref:Uncharacterized protein n=1 Tax=Acidithiobacillus ferridurans TaxID=1232575 RepID=A0A8X8KAT1_ACIFI|nr:hypothetical protein [Acidithiobacillus ferridurans]MBU2716962.1 hypothetical protein [Acidithiobacillus ferridurans]MBU2721809.1 hypothetical protein [Acidithiobacillus ferridurans]MBU2726929.1 hypothetical protein [Acidithiobacillus ferridurans]